MEVQRLLVTNAIESFPDAILEPLNLRFNSLFWKTDVTPGVGSDSQEVITSQIHDTYDIYIGILGTHFGSPTDKAGSGTEQEFDDAYLRYEKDPASVRILFYFMTSARNLFDVDFKELEKVKSFRKKLQDGGVLYFDCIDDDALARAVTNHLVNLCQKQWNKGSWVVLSPRSAGNKVLALKTETAIATQLADAGLDDPDWENGEPGFLDVMVSATEATAPLLEIMQRITDHHAVLTQSMVRPTMVVSSETQTPQLLKWAVDEVAEALRTYVKEMRREFPSFKSFTDQIVEVLPRIARAHFEEGVGTREEIEGMPEALGSLIDGMRSARIGISSLRDQVESVPGYTRKLKAAQRLTIELLDEYIAYIIVMLGRLEDDSSAIARALDESVKHQDSVAG